MIKLTPFISLNQAK